jgi:hypothetical protein
MKISVFKSTYVSLVNAGWMRRAEQTKLDQEGNAIFPISIER